MCSAASPTCCIAVESHPAMLFYLDNVHSMGADSIAGINRDKGLNENLAREILELHTLGVRSGYSQADVTSFAKVLTGWTSIDAADPAHGGEFRLQQAPARAGRADRARQVLCPKRCRSGPCRARRLGASYGDGATRRTKARPPLCRRRTAAVARRQVGKSLHGQRRQSERRRQGVGDSRRSRGRRRAPSSSGRPNGSSACCG